nr:RHS repeat-associated core domain-containing protein [Ignavibacteria bacterium]
EEGKFKFTGKERDEESFYDYFGARYYDSRIGRWGQVEPLLEDFLSFSPYVYSVNSPIRFLDFDGKDVIISGDNSKDVYGYLKDEFKNLKLKWDKNGKLSYGGIAKTEEEILLLNAIDNPDVIVNLISILENNVGDNYISIGLYTGSNYDDQGRVQVTQYFNVEHAKIWREAGGGTIGRSILHEVLEGYIGGYFYPGQDYSQSYLEAHTKTVALEDPPRYYPEIKTGVLYDPVKGVNIFNRKFLIDANGVEHLLYTKDDID